MNDLVPRLEDGGLARDLILQRALNKFERVKILDLSSGSELKLPNRTKGDVRVTSKASLFHVAIADAEVADKLADSAKVRRGFRRGVNLGLGYNLKERYASAV